MKTLELNHISLRKETDMTEWEIYEVLAHIQQGTIEGKYTLYTMRPIVKIIEEQLFKQLQEKYK
jgi:hypothetical protein